jgi:glycosyltransferase involved in cell wall biosynthesis
MDALPRTALIHDFLLDLRGGERVFLELCEMFPEADIFTAVFDEDGTEGRFDGRRIHTSFLQRVRPSARNFRALLPLYPAAIESLDLSGYDLVISSSSAWAHAVLCDEHSLHVSYCHNPFRYAWNDRDTTLSRRMDPLSRWMLRSTFRRWRQWDWEAAQRTDRYVANSRTTQARIRAYFGRSADVVPPPVDTARFSPRPVGEHYLTVSELVPHKQLDVAVDAFARLTMPLFVVGDGPQAKRLRRIASPNVTFTGRLPDRDVAELMATCRALVVTSIEEFGMAAVECQAAGRPVIARLGGGALETIVDGVTGRFFTGGPADLARAVLLFDDHQIDPQDCVENARRFDKHLFRERLRSQIQIASDNRARGQRHARQPLPGLGLIRRGMAPPPHVTTPATSPVAGR